MLVLLARAMGAKNIVATVDTSMTVEEAGFTLTRTRVGDTFVSEELRKHGTFGGEPSGAWIFPDVSYCPDGIYAAALLASLATRQEIASMVDGIPVYPMLRGSVPGTPADAPRIKVGLLGLSPESSDEADGIKVLFKDGWILVRPSGTEPKIRITAEAKTEARAKELYDRAVAIVAGSQA
jgi:phosphoglucosamine mutase